MKTSKPKEYKPGDKVFAKVRGHPHWPARINPLPPDVKVSKGKFPIFFFGTHEVYFLQAKDIFPYEDNKEKYGTQKKQYLYNEGLTEIIDNPDVLRYGVDENAQAFLARFYKFERTDDGREWDDGTESSHDVEEQNNVEKVEEKKSSTKKKHKILSKLSSDSDDDIPLKALFGKTESKNPADADGKPSDPSSVSKIVSPPEKKKKSPQPKLKIQKVVSLEEMSISSDSEASDKQHSPKIKEKKVIEKSSKYNTDLQKKKRKMNQSNIKDSSSTPVVKKVKLNEDGQDKDTPVLLINDESEGEDEINLFTPDKQKKNKISSRKTIDQKPSSSHVEEVSTNLLDDGELDADGADADYSPDAVPKKRVLK